MSNDSSGWVASHRSIQKHWLNNHDDYYRWWDIMVKTVNHCDHKFVVGNGFSLIKRGQSALSKIHWRELLSNTEYKIGRKRFNTFLDLLINDDMITVETVRGGNSSTSLITITNYGHYQDIGTSQGTSQRTSQRTTIEQLNNYNNSSSIYNTDSTTADRFKDADKTFSSIDAYNMFIEDLKEGVYALKTDSLKKAYKYDSESLGTEIERFKHHSIDMDTRYDNSMGYYRHLSNYIKNKHNK